MNNETIIGKRYQINSLDADRIGRGGMGDVYKAIDLQTHEYVAVKHLKADVLALDETSVERFDREGEALRRLNHPNIVKVLETVEEWGDHYIVMEYVEGGSLRDRLSGGVQIAVDEVLKIALELADALTRAHHLNIVHRDIKPANVLLAGDGTPRLTDFGVAHIGDLARITQTGLLTGTYTYVSPEACDGSILNARADIWSFGVVLYEMLTGKRPFDEPNLTATITAILSKPVPDLTQFRPDIPEALTNLIYRMLEKKRSKRIGSVRLVGAQLEAIITGLDSKPLRLDGSRFETTSLDIAPAMGPRHNLPPQPTPFVGREPEVQELVNLLNDADCRLLTLVGPGGMGKTRLALEVASRQIDEFKYGVRFVGLAGVTGTEFMVTAVADALNFTFPNQDDPKGQLLTFLREKELLLIMDNFEHLIDGAELVADILTAAPKLKVLATSRESLNLWEEWLRPILGMRYPENDSTEEIDPYSAVKLFADRAKRVRGGFSLEAALPNIIRICQLVEGMPLGIELAATWLKVLSPEQIVAEIESNFDFLSTSMRNIEERHRSLRAVFDYSWQLLTEHEQRVFKRLSVFRGSFNRQAAERIAGASLMTLTNLVNKSLLHEGGTAVSDNTTTTTGSKYRYTMHELLRQYAADRLAEDGNEQVATAAKHAEYYGNLLHQQESHLKGHQQKQALEIIRTNIDNVRVAWRWALANFATESQALTAVLEASNSLYLFYEYGGKILEGIEIFGETALAAKKLADTLLQKRVLAKALSLQGILAFKANEFKLGDQLALRSHAILREIWEDHALPIEVLRSTQADFGLSMVYYSYSIARTQSMTAVEEALDEVIEISKRIEDSWLLVRALNALGNTLRDFDRKKELYEESIRISRHIGDELYLALVGVNYVNWVSLPHEVQPLIEEIVAIYQRMESQAGMALGYGLLAANAFRTGNYLQAKELQEKSLVIYRELGLIYYYIPSLQGQGNNLWALGELSEAESYMKQALELVRESGDLENTIKSNNAIGQFYLETGDLSEARRYYKMSLALLPNIHNSRQKAEALDSLGNFAILLGEYGQARQHFEANIPHFEEIGNREGVAWALRNFGTIAYELGDYETAVARFQESLGVFRSFGYNWALMTLLDCLGRVAYALGDEAKAEAHYREALVLPQNFWTIFNQLELTVDWSALLMKQGEVERPFRNLTIVSRLPIFVPPTIHLRVRNKAHRLLAELEAKLPIEQVADIKLGTRHLGLDDVVSNLLEEREISLP